MQKIAVVSNTQKFLAEFVGTFVVVFCATASVVINAKSGNNIGLWFEAFAPFAAVSAMVFVFAKTSMAHFNPAVSLAFLITGHLRPKEFPVYLGAELLGAFSASLAVKYIIGTEANLGANVPNYEFTLPIIAGTEALATAFLVFMILIVVYTKGLKGFGSIAIGSVVFFDIFFLSFISGASMNPARSLAPAVVSGEISHLWLYLSLPFVGSAATSLAFYKKFPKT